MPLAGATGEEPLALESGECFEGTKERCVAGGGPDKKAAFLTT